MSLSGGRPFKSPPPPRFFSFHAAGQFSLLYFPFSLSPLGCNSSLRSAAGEEEGEKGKAVPSSSRSPKNQRPGKRGGGGRGKEGKSCATFFLGGNLIPSSSFLLEPRTNPLFLAFVPLTPPLGAEGKGPRDYWSRDFFISRRRKRNHHSSLNGAKGRRRSQPLSQPA